MSKLKYFAKIVLIDGKDYYDKSLNVAKMLFCVSLTKLN